jgi:hypothetical protein
MGNHSMEQSFLQGEKDRRNRRRKPSGGERRRT